MVNLHRARGTWKPTYGDELPNFMYNILLPEVAAGEELAREHDHNEHDKQELQQAKTAHLGLVRGIWLLWAHLLATGNLRIALLLALEPGLMLGIPALLELCIA